MPLKIDEYITPEEAVKQLDEVIQLMNDMHWDHTFHPEKVGEHWLKASEIARDLRFEIVKVGIRDEIKRRQKEKTQAA